MWVRHSCFPLDKLQSFGDPLTFCLAPSSGQRCNKSSTLVNEQIPAELMTFASASADVKPQRMANASMLTAKQ